MTKAITMLSRKRSVYFIIIRNYKCVSTYKYSVTK